MHGCHPVKPLSAYSLNEYGLGEANLLIQVHAVLEQPCIPSSCIPNRSSLAQRPVEVSLGPIIYPPLYVSTKGLTFHTDGVVEDVRHHDCAKELEVSEVEAVTKLKVSWLRPLCTGPGHIKDCLLFRIVSRVEESQPVLRMELALASFRPNPNTLSTQKGQERKIGEIMRDEAQAGQAAVEEERTE